MPLTSITNTLKLKQKNRFVLSTILLLVLFTAAISSFATSGTSRYSTSFNANNATIVKGASNSNGVIAFNDKTTTITTPITNPNPTFEAFDRNTYIETDSWTNGLPLTRTTNGQGSFRTNCHPSHLAYVDPIVFPGQNGASHLHMFYGNRKADHNSTETSLKNTGMGSCDGGPLNRTAYWIPAMLNNSGKVELPINTIVYYKTEEATSSKVQPMPNGLRMIAGNGMAHAPQNSGHNFHKFKCVADNGNGATIYDEQALIGDCPTNSRLYLVFNFPQCWDGVSKGGDGTDHKSHLTYLDWGSTSCPGTHPVLIPQVSLNIAWQTANESTSGWYLASDDMTKMGMGMMPGGTTIHADWFIGWDDAVKNTWFSNCLQKVLSCNGGQTGDGKNLKRVTIDYPGPFVVNKPANVNEVVVLPNSGL